MCSISDAQHMSTWCKSNKSSTFFSNAFWTKKNVMCMIFMCTLRSNKEYIPPSRLAFAITLNNTEFCACSNLEFIHQASHVEPPSPCLEFGPWDVILKPERFDTSGQYKSRKTVQSNCLCLFSSNYHKGHDSIHFNSSFTVSLRKTQHHVQHI